MKPFELLDAVALPIEQANVDTDQVLPARYLQKPRANDFGQFLFRDLRFRKDGSEEPSFMAQPRALPGGARRRRRPQFRLRLLARARRVGALRLRGARRDRAELRRHLFRQFAQERSSASSCRPKKWSRTCSRPWSAAPGSRIGVDLAQQVVTAPDGTQHAFHIDPFPKHCLLEGFDELDYTLSQMDRIIRFERLYDVVMPAMP